ncbi:MAG: hypothetical protein ACYSUX_16975 [Planctomycetota bacterium]|jgi:hypothetical protein
MDAKDLIKIGRKAKSETEIFINRYLNDRAKGWPKLCFCDSLYSGARRIEKKAIRA